ncbi:alpha/beta fold hydrolase [Cryptosporangium phraense]|uniref:Alpha/beta hydrolase n=1 Tax=Cryptosporangium phraense TaxID=2593070 RepID=A0A545AFP8_9ACTN|nr:alpha/beta hydrolase [Cryptosporangium phraense]TQS40158.1 alpha/beta hydrolase [Cryptosporangium phraense]
MDTVTSADGTRIAFDRYGSGPALILVGGASQHRAIDPGTGDLARLLAEDLTVYHYDRRGRGDSGLSWEPYRPEREIEDIAALIEHAGGNAALYGMSSGAALALDAAARRPAVTKVAVYEPPFIVDDSRTPIRTDLQPRLERLILTEQRDGAVELFLTEAAGVPPEAVEGLKRTPHWAALEAVSHTYPYDIALLEGTQTGAPLSPHRWAAVTVPVLVVDGGASPDWMHAGADALAAVLLDATRETLDGQTHDVDAKALAPSLRRFFT